MDIIEEVFTHNDRIILYALIGAVLLVCLLTMYWVYRTMKLIEKKVKQMENPVRVVMPEQEQILPPAIHYNAATQNIRRDHILALPSLN